MATIDYWRFHCPHCGAWGSGMPDAVQALVLAHPHAVEMWRVGDRANSVITNTGLLEVTDGN